jgi:hypothetical protein
MQPFRVRTSHLCFAGQIPGPSGPVIGKQRAMAKDTLAKMQQSREIVTFLPLAMLE